MLEADLTQINVKVFSEKFSDISQHAKLKKLTSELYWTFILFQLKVPYKNLVDVPKFKFILTSVANTYPPDTISLAKHPNLNDKIRIELNG